MVALANLESEIFVTFDGQVRASNKLSSNNISLILIFKTTIGKYCCCSVSSAGSLHEGGEAREGHSDGHGRLVYHEMMSILVLYFPFILFRRYSSYFIFDCLYFVAFSQ